MKKKPRGSTAGLRKLQEDTKKQNSEAMMTIIRQLRIESPARKWTYREVWSKAGLKSQVALDSPWNTHIRNLIDEHNLEIKAKEIVNPSKTNIDKTSKNYIRELRELKRQRDAALSKIASYAADVHYYKKKLSDLTIRFERYKANSENQFLAINSSPRGDN